jgi:hypothetical protein
MPFINGLWIEEPKINKQKIKIKPSQINMSVIYGSQYLDTYKILTSIMLQNNINQTRPIQNRDIDKEFYKKSLISKLSPLDKKYMKLKSFNTINAEYVFDVNKWLNDALKNINPKSKSSKFEKRFKFAVNVPPIIANHSARLGFDNFIVKKFKQYMDKHNKTNTWFKTFFPKSISNKISKNYSNMFDYEYDWQTNSIVAKLKPAYVMALLFSVGVAATKAKNYNKYMTIDFEKSVKKKAKLFDKKKWDKFIKQRFI